MWRGLSQYMFLLNQCCWNEYKLCVNCVQYLSHTENIYLFRNGLDIQIKPNDRFFAKADNLKYSSIYTVYKVSGVLKKKLQSNWFDLQFQWSPDHSNPMFLPWIVFMRSAKSQKSMSARSKEYTKPVFRSFSTTCYMVRCLGESEHCS